MGKHTGLLYTQAKIGSLNSNQISIEDILKYIQNQQTITTSSNNYGHFDEIFDYQKPIKISAILQQNNTPGFNSLIAISNKTGDASLSTTGFNCVTLGQYSSTIGLGYYSNSFNNFTSVNRVNHTQPSNSEYLVECEIDNNGLITSKITRLSDSTVLFTGSDSMPIDVTGYKICILQRGAGSTKYREVKIM